MKPPRCRVCKRTDVDWHNQHGWYCAEHSAALKRRAEGQARRNEVHNRRADELALALDDGAHRGESTEARSRRLAREAVAEDEAEVRARLNG